MVPILDFDQPRCPWFSLRKNNWLKHLLVFQQSRMRNPIRAQQPIATKISIVGRVAKVTAIGIENLTISRLLANPLVHPIPDKAALQSWIGGDGIPILLQVARAVAHRVSI